MLQGIGAPAVPSDAVDLLLECHQRIRAFLELAGRIAGAEDASPEALADAAGRVHRYFAEALPLHARDEEESILPRLRGRDAVVDAELDAMVREHAEHEGPLTALVDACARLAREPERWKEIAPAVAGASEALGRHFAGHLVREESVVFPAVRRLLDPAADEQMVREIRLRREARAGR